MTLESNISPESKGGQAPFLPLPTVANKDASLWRSVVTYNGITMLHFLLGGIGLILGYASWPGYLLGSIYLVFAFTEMYILMEHLDSSQTIPVGKRYCEPRIWIYARYF